MDNDWLRDWERRLIVVEQTTMGIREDIASFRTEDTAKHDKIDSSIQNLRGDIKKDLREHMDEERDDSASLKDSVDQLQRWWWMAIGVLGFIAMVAPILVRILWKS